VLGGGGGMRVGGWGLGGGRDWASQLLASESSENKVNRFK
jgi:hypothetical protein